jgi:hypothetical protein
MIWGETRLLFARPSLLWKNWLYLPRSDNAHLLCVVWCVRRGSETAGFQPAAMKCEQLEFKLRNTDACTCFFIIIPIFKKMAMISDKGLSCFEYIFEPG